LAEVFGDTSERALKTVVGNVLCIPEVGTGTVVSIAFDTVFEKVLGIANETGFKTVCGGESWVSAANIDAEPCTVVDTA
jgi:hypothetical protein